MQSSFSIIALSVFAGLISGQEAPFSQVKRRSYGSTPSYSHAQPKAYAPKPKAYKAPSYIPKPKAYHPAPKKYEAKPIKKTYTAKAPSYTPAKSY
ncbi:hypothetical protein DSO57_1039562 [Entomophthora muscae]|uniref:Uncharacterized protein n=3 Tax=Entomophthora muscae TaxID=34485 RepID=A0ACC2SFB7_9FUNG|nr:hypothetical protein DSO57_1026450 [Entomophthora muscae]KAJ9060857.1 hypothetical protein DSO57_1026451 [Entomophthora muscae]KAJ9067395.1 hypothetical protein DSO57_1039562 [Entomophthora muscae]